MKYVNANTTCFKSVIMDGDKIVSFNAPFEVIKATNIDNTLFIEDFSLVTQIDFLGTSDSEHKMENPLEQKKTVDFIVRLTKCTRKEEDRLGFDLDSFSIDLEDIYKKEKVDTACFDFFNYTKITNVKRLDLPCGDGKYVIKVLIKGSEEEEYSIQSMTQLTIM
ncbi:MAG: hypothetical protein NC293_12065 [Roseburia sp.]|nr:hypothetical protein [Roseburia sp.]